MTLARSGSRPMQPGDIDSKLKKTVIEVLKSKHPDMVVPDFENP